MNSGHDSPEATARSVWKGIRTASPGGFVAEWVVAIVLLLFGTTTLVQAFVIPTGSMEDTLLVGDHLLVDKLAYAPADHVASNMLPYEP
jgi:signal peptidase I